MLYIFGLCSMKTLTASWMASGSDDMNISIMSCWVPAQTDRQTDVETGRWPEPAVSWLSLPTSLESAHYSTPPAEKERDKRGRSEGERGSKEGKWGQTARVWQDWVVSVMSTETHPRECCMWVTENKYRRHIIFYIISRANVYIFYYTSTLE